MKKIQLHVVDGFLHGFFGFAGKLLGFAFALLRYAFTMQRCVVRGFADTLFANQQKTMWCFVLVK